MGNLFAARVGNILTALLGNVLTVGVGKVLDIYTHPCLTLSDGMSTGPSPSLPACFTAPGYSVASPPQDKLACPLFFSLNNHLKNGHVQIKIFTDSPRLEGMIKNLFNS